LTKIYLSDSLALVLLLVAACCISAARLPGVAHSTQFVLFTVSPLACLALDWEQPENTANKPRPSAAIIKKLFKRDFIQRAESSSILGLNQAPPIG